MHMIVMLHVLVQGGVLDAAQSVSLQQLTAWGSETLAHPVINAFTRVSDYVELGGRHRYSSIGNLILVTLSFDYFVMYPL